MMKEEFYKYVLDESPSAYAFHRIILDEAGKPCDYEFLEVNQAFEHMTGMKATDIIGRRITEVLPNIGTTEYDWIRTYGEVALTGRAVEFDQHSEGLDRWYRIKAYSPEKYYFITSFVDKSSEAEQEAALRNFFDVSLDMLCIADMKGYILRTNRAWERILGYKEEAVTGKEYLSFVHPEDTEKTKKAMQELEYQKEVIRHVNRFRDSIGDYRYIEWCGHVEGEIAYVAARDISEKIQEEKKIKSLLDETETIFNATQDALFMMGINGKGFHYIKNNTAYQKLTGISSIKGKTPKELWGEAIYERVTENYMRCIQQNKAVTYEENLPLPNGDRTILTMLTPVLENGKPVYIVGSRRDITEEKKREEELRLNLARNETLVKVLQHESNSVQEYLDFALEQALELTKSKYGYIYFYDEAKKEFTLNTWSSEVMKDCSVQKQATVYQLDQTGIWGEAVRQRKPVVINDFQAPNPLKKGYPKGHIDFTRFMTIPVIHRKAIVAVVGVADKDCDYNEIDVLQLTILMNNVWKEVNRKKSEAMLFEEKERLRITLLSVGDGVIATDADGKIRLMNEVAEKLTGWPFKEAENVAFPHVFNIINEYTRVKCEDPIQKVLDSGKVIGLANHTILIAKDGSERPIADSAAPIQQEDGETKGVILVFRDVTTQRQRQAVIEHLSFHDQLTDLFNRRFFDEELHRLDTERNLPLALVMADVNGLKLTNDAFGHAMGDQLLIKAAETIQACCRKDDIIARLGGDEFVILLPKTSEKKAEVIAQRIMLQCANIRVDAVSLSISCGWAVKHSTSESIHEVLKKSEDRMYQRKLFEGPSIRSQVIDAVVKALYEVNRREKKHSERVSMICEKFAIALGCTERERQELRTAGLLHDIGKVAIDISVIDKPGPLTESEWIEIRRHPEIGYRILTSVNDMSEIAQSILAHHERWDGTGYPRGIGGEDIPLHARILAIADAYDAMTCERPYREPMSLGQVENEMIIHSGTQFDTNLVQLFLKAVAPVLRNASGT